MSKQDAANDDDYDDIFGWADITADDFMNEIFDGVIGAPVVVNIQPARPGVQSSVWQMPWRSGFFASEGPGPWYFGNCTSDTVEKGGYARRKKENLVMAACLVLDDIGTKVDLQRVKAMMPPPSWIARTSHGNYQWGYILNGAHPDAAEVLLKRLAGLGLTDPGAKAITQVFRVPGSLNLKHDPPVVTRLEVWKPERLYTLDQLAAGLPADAGPGDQAQQGEAHDHQHSPEDAAQALECIKHIKNDSRFDARADWIIVGAALHDATGGSAEGLAAWVEWTESGSWPVEDCAKDWASFKVGGGRGIGTLLRYAKQDGYDPRPDPSEAFSAPPEGYEEAASSGQQQQTGTHNKLSDSLYGKIADEPHEQPDPLVAQLVPSEVVGVVIGSGGAGKGILLQTLCACVASRKNVPFLDYPVQQHGVAVFWTAEDRKRQLLFRQERINARLGIGRDDLADRLVLKSHRDAECILWLNGNPTPLLIDILKDASAMGARLITIDSASICYGDEEIKRLEVAQFLRWLDLWAELARCTVIVVLHTSRTSDGTVERLSSGSTAWTFQARFALLLQKDDDDAISLTVSKINYGKPGLKVDLQWTEGGVLEAMPFDGAAESQQQADDDLALLQAIGDQWGSGDSGYMKNSEPKLTQAMGRTPHEWKTGRTEKCLSRVSLARWVNYVYGGKKRGWALTDAGKSYLASSTAE